MSLRLHIEMLQKKLSIQHEVLVRAQHALRSADALFNVALPKFNWGASSLDADAIKLLNEVPGEVRAALDLVRENVELVEPARVNAAVDSQPQKDAHEL